MCRAPPAETLQTTVPGSSDLVGVIMAMGGVDLEPALDGVVPVVAVRAGSAPLVLGELLEQVDVGGSHSDEERNRRIDRPLVVQSPRELHFVVGVDDWFVFGE